MIGLNLFGVEGLVFFSLIFLFWIIVFGVFIAMLIFWILMLIDAIKRDFKKEADKIVWIIVIVFVGIIGAILYYFIVKRKDLR